MKAEILDPKSIKQTREIAQKDRGEVVEIGSAHKVGDTVYIGYASVDGKNGKIVRVTVGKPGIVYGKYQIPSTTVHTSLNGETPCLHIVSFGGTEYTLADFMYAASIPCEHLEKVKDFNNTDEDGVVEARTLTMHAFRIKEKRSPLARFRGIKDEAGNGCGSNLATTLGEKLRSEVWEVVGGAAKLRGDVRTVSHAEKVWEPSEVRVDYRTIVWDGDAYADSIGDTFKFDAARLQ